MKRYAHTFLAGAKSRLLPVTVPFRYFGAACVFHVLAWCALFAGADIAPRFAGGLGWPLAALHLVTLGVLAMTAMGASLQLLPVATRQPVRVQRAPALIWWVYTPGVAAIALGMGTGHVRLLVAGAGAVALALAAYGVLLALNLRGAKGMPAVVAHGWIALVSLGLLLVTALSLALSYVGVPLLARSTAVTLHITFAAYGFMGMLVLGLSYVLVPMFALSPPYDERRAIASCALAALALLLAATAAFGLIPRALLAAALLAASAAVALHLRLMRAALATGLRRELGRSFTLVRIAWALLAASLPIALGVALEWPVNGLPSVFGLVVIAGWLLTMLLGMLQRIVPFLASMHAIPGTGRPPTPSTLTAPRPLAIHFWCHLVALAALLLAIVADSAALARVAAAVGAAGAIAFGIFFVIVMWRRCHPVRATATARASVA